MSGEWEVYAIKYAAHVNRLRKENFLFDDAHSAPGPIDFFVWVLKRGEEVILVDTGYDTVEGKRRGKPVMVDPVVALRDFGIAPEAITRVIITHLHFDHAGSLEAFANAHFHLQAAEMAYATGPCMCHDAMRAPFTGEHVCAMVRHVYSGRVTFHEGDGQVVSGVEVIAIGGHSRGLQAVRVQTAHGPLILASDAAHLYENLMLRKPFPIVADLEPMLKGYGIMEALVTDRGRIVPGHDPLVGRVFPRVAGSEDGPCLIRLDAGYATAPQKVLGDLW